MGRSDRDPTSRRWNSGHFVVGSASDPGRIFFTVRLRFPQIRLFPDMIRAVTEKNDHSVKGSISGFQTLIIATATRVGWEIWLE